MRRSGSRFMWLAAALALGASACGHEADDDHHAEEAADRSALAACQLDDGTIERGARLRACAPGDMKKTTICHVPPGNPANAHTICIGNAAVAKHLANHDDYLGPCKVEVPCAPPPPQPPSGAAGAGGAAGGSGAGGAAGAPPFAPRPVIQ